MNRLLENNLLQEIPCGANFAYVLQDNTLFQATDYKVLRSHADGGFVKCMKMLYNGKVQLYYLAGSLKNLSVVLPNLSTEGFLTVVTNLLDGILEAKSNGFLSCENIELSFDKIFVDPVTLKVSLVYVPVSTHLFADSLAFETRLRSELIRAIRQMPALVGPKVQDLEQSLTGGVLSLEELYARMKGGSMGKQEKPRAEEPKKEKKLRFVSMNASKTIEILITKDHFVFGKDPSCVDGCIGFSGMVSRVHCCVDQKGEQYTITDLRSTNGTYVNGMKLTPNQPKTIHSGDIIKLANAKFQIVVK